MSRRLLFRFFLLIPLLAACGAGIRGPVPPKQQGTETGNPGNPTGDVPSPPAIDRLLGDLCSRIRTCDPSISFQTCFSRLEGAEGSELDNEFGLPEGQFPIDKIREGLSNGTIVTNDVALSNCESAIAAVPCDQVNPNVSPDSFSNVENFVPEVCKQVF